VVKSEVKVRSGKAFRDSYQCALRCI
jgi:hypothetical protein